MSITRTGRSKVSDGAGDGSAATTARNVAMLGNLSQVGVPALLTLVDLEQRTGVLLLKRPRETGIVWLRNGRVIQARAEGSFRCTGKTALFHLLAWNAGQFELTFGSNVDGEDEIGRPTTFLLMEAARRTDEAGARLAG